MSENKIGGGESRTHFFLIFLTGLLIGSLVRVAAFIMPKSSVNFLMKKLLPISDPE